jgi:hypothetical protein
VQNDLVMWFANETPNPSPTAWLGVDQPVWSIITGVAAVVATLISICVALYTLRAADRREHHRWLQEKRREAYVTFITAARDAYQAIDERGQKVRAPRSESDFSKDEWAEHEDTEADIDRKLAKARADIDRKLGEVMRAQDVLAIVGPEEMEELGLGVIARLKLDRGYYSPTGWSSRKKPEDQASILRNAEDTGNRDLLNELRDSLKDGTVDVEAFRAAFHKHKLDSFWNAFNERARSVLKESKPGRHR